jgi:hypothetical protein
MSEKVFTRAYLHSIPQERKQELFSYLINQFINLLLNNAALGKTSYIVDVDNLHPPTGFGVQTPSYTNCELVEAVRARFPDCSVNYYEVWVEQLPPKTSKVLRKGILIDWSYGRP